MVSMGFRDTARLLQHSAPFSLACLPNYARPSSFDGQLLAASRPLPRLSRSSHHESEASWSPVFGGDQPRGGLPRFHVETLPSYEGLVVRIEGDEFWHMTKVVRLKVEDRVELFDGRGGIVECSLRSIHRQGAHVVAVDRPRILPLTGPSWHVAAALGSLKGGRGDWLVEKCTELGARTLTPLLTQRSSSVTGGRNDRWSRVVQAATKQCQRLHSLELRDPTDLRSFLPEVAKCRLALLAVAEAPPLCAALAGRALEEGILLVGPEGDFTEEETSAMVEAGAIPVGLGPRRLRVETAAIAMLSAVTLIADQSLSSTPP